MKPVSPELISLLASRQFFVADLYTVNLQTGGSLYYCGGDANIVCNGITYSAGAQTGPYWDRTDNKAKCHWKVGVDVDQLVVDVLPGSAQVLGASFMQAIHNGVFDGAEVILDRVFMPTYGDTSRGVVRYFVGRVAEIDVGRGVATFTINSHLELLNIQMPRNLYQAGCVNNLGDAACGVNLANYTASGVIAASSTKAVFLASSIGAVSAFPGGNQAGAFDLGTMTMTSGALEGQVLSVKSVTYGTPSAINLTGFAASAPAAGDTFTITYGCNKNCDLPTTVNGIMTAGQNNLDLVNGSSGSSALIGYTMTGYGIPGGGYTVTSYASAAPGTPPMPTNGALYLSGNFTVTSKDQSHIYTLTNAGQVLNGCSKFSNQAKFRGFPFVPYPSTAAG